MYWRNYFRRLSETLKSVDILVMTQVFAIFLMPHPLCAAVQNVVGRNDISPYRGRRIQVEIKRCIYVRSNILYFLYNPNIYRGGTQGAEAVKGLHKPSLSRHTRKPQPPHIPPSLTPSPAPRPRRILRPLHRQNSLAYR